MTRPHFEHAIAGAISSSGIGTCEALTLHLHPSQRHDIKWSVVLRGTLACYSRGNGQA
jgi:hypothetical protein